MPVTHFDMSIRRGGIRMVKQVRIAIIIVAIICVFNALLMQRASALIVSNAKSCDLMTQGMGEYNIFYQYFNDGNFTKAEGTQALRLSVSYVKSAVKHNTNPMLGISLNGLVINELATYKLLIEGKEVPLQNVYLPLGTYGLLFNYCKGEK